ncbi:hypothetical protein [Candidatus Poriferisocius sp.]|uniref:hypothetical protein n=1 Tax=Candidatus Poriferisocius sp. TaxID=3101276 RepID=UPI003B02CA2D
MRQDRGQRGLRRRGEEGLTTLSWMLITAAVAGLAALAVVLVYQFVGETGERFAAPNPRKTTAELQAANVVDRAKEATADDFATWDEWEHHFSTKCRLIEVTIADERITVAASEFNGPTAGGTRFTIAPARAAHNAAPTASMAQANCMVQ